MECNDKIKIEYKKIMAELLELEENKKLDTREHELCINKLNALNDLDINERMIRRKDVFEKRNNKDLRRCGYKSGLAITRRTRKSLEQL